MKNENLLLHMLANPIPQPVMRFEQNSMTMSQFCEKISIRDLFLNIVAYLYNGSIQLPEDYRLFDPNVLTSGLVQYDPDVKSWKSLLKKTVELLQSPGTLAEKRAIFETWLPQRLGCLDNKKLAWLFHELKQTISQPLLSVSTPQKDLKEILETAQIVLDS